MKAFAIVFSFLILSTPILRANDLPKARLLEKEGDKQGARSVLQKLAQGSSDAETLLAYAEFLDRHKDPDSRAAYERALQAVKGDQRKASAIARRLVALALLADDRDSAVRHLETYKNYGGAFDAQALKPLPAAAALPTVPIPGPLRSFARMAALSPDLAPEDLLPALARNVVTSGYQASAGNEGLEQTEYLKLVVRYISQARELEKLGAADQIIKIDSCESTQTGDLLKVLGYRMRGGCGSEVVLETVNATRAFLTIDSGFPLAALEQALRTNRPFRYDFQPTKIPVLYGPEYWLSAREKQSGDFIDQFLADPSVCRLYLGLSKLDPETAEELKKQMPPQRIKAFAHVLDFYGAMFLIRNGEAVVPGGAKTAGAWKDLVGVAPQQGAQFFERLVSREDGWLSSYFDALARIEGPAKDYLLEPRRLQRFYNALRGKVSSPGPARPVFRSSTDLMLLTQRIRVEGDGRIHIPGGLEIWKNLFINHPHGKYDGKLTKAATGWKDPDDLIEALFALCRKSVENEPLKIYMALSDLNRFRTKPLATETVDRLARSYRAYGAQYPIFSEAPAVSDKTILLFLDAAEGIGDIRDQALRADTAGSMQALVGLWQIFVRQGSIAPAEADATLATVLNGFLKVKNNRELFDHARSGTRALMKAAGGTGEGSLQDRMLDLLAGAAAPSDGDAHRQMVQDMIRVFEAQRLVSLSTLFDLADHLEGISKGEKLNVPLVSKLASRIAEIQLPRASLSAVEKNALAFGYWTEKHIEAQRRINVRAAIDRAAGDPEKLADLRGQFAPILRDTLVGMNYIHYAPPGAQLLTTNPLFVRSHDFLGVQGSHQTWRQTEVFGSGWPSSAGGRLVGSLTSLPYALAESEQNFLIPTREQALIWGDLVPQMMLTAKVPRWWKVSPDQIHWISLHMNRSESLLAETALDGKLLTEVMESLSRWAPPVRVRKVRELLQQGNVAASLEFVTPSELYLLSTAWWSGHADEDNLLASERRRLLADHPEHLTSAAISRAFGTPKPTLAHTYQPELLNLRTFPTLMGYSSRIMAESWESNLLFYAALADEVHMAPSQLNVMVPEWTQLTVEKIFATHLEDWPALLRSLRLVGEDVRAKARKQMLAEQKASLQ